MWDVNDIAVRIITNAIPILIFGMGKSVQNIDYYNRIKKKKHHYVSRLPIAENLLYDNVYKKTSK